MSIKSVVLFAVLCVAVLAIPFSSANAQAIPGIKPAAVETKMDDEELIKKASYLLVYNQLGEMVVQLRGAGVELDEEQAVAGLRKLLKGEPVGMDIKDIQATMRQFSKKVQGAQMAKMKEIADANVAKGKAFFAENAKKEGVKTMENGVQYEVMVEGTGPKPKPTDRVKINYHGTLLNGTVFDSTLQPSQGQPVKPYEAPANIFVPGFTAAIVQMPVGSKWKIAIPGDQGYGLRGRGPIGPNETILFEVELLEIIDEPAAQDK